MKQLFSWILIGLMIATPSMTYAACIWQYVGNNPVTSSSVMYSGITELYAPKLAADDDGNISLAYLAPTYATGISYQGVSQKYPEVKYRDKTVNQTPGNVSNNNGLPENNWSTMQSIPQISSDDHVVGMDLGPTGFPIIAYRNDTLAHNPSNNTYTIQIRRYSSPQNSTNQVATFSNRTNPQHHLQNIQVKSKGNIVIVAGVEMPTSQLGSQIKGSYRLRITRSINGGEFQEIVFGSGAGLILINEGYSIDIGNNGVIYSIHTEAGLGFYVKKIIDNLHSNTYFSSWSEDNPNLSRSYSLKVSNDNRLHVGYRSLFNNTPVPLVRGTDIVLGSGLVNYDSSHAMFSSFNLSLSFSPSNTSIIGPYHINNIAATSITTALDRFDRPAYAIQSPDMFRSRVRLVGKNRNNTPNSSANGDPNPIWNSPTHEFGFGLPNISTSQDFKIYGRPSLVFDALNRPVVAYYSSTGGAISVIRYSCGVSAPINGQCDLSNTNNLVVNEFGSCTNGMPTRITSSGSTLIRSCQGQYGGMNSQCTYNQTPIVEEPIIQDPCTTQPTKKGKTCSPQIETIYQSE